MTQSSPATASELTEQAARIAESAVAAADAAVAARNGVEPPARDVIEALRRVMRDLPAIGKDQQSSAAQGSYRYRGIEQITVHTQGLFARHGVVFTPHVRSWEIRDLTVGGKPWTDTILSVEYSIYGPGGELDLVTIGPLLAIGRDNSDKGANKAMTQAFKYALLQVLSISDAKDDADGSAHEADAPLPAPEWTAGMAKQELLNLLGGDREKAAAAWEWASGPSLTEFSAEVAHDIATRWQARPLPEATQEPPDAPESTPGTDAVPEATEAHSDAQGPNGDRVEQVIDYVGALGRERLAAELVAAGLDKTGDVPVLRQRLGAHLLETPDWQPPQETLV